MRSRCLCLRCPRKVFFLWGEAAFPHRRSCRVCSSRYCCWSSPSGGGAGASVPGPGVRSLRPIISISGKEGWEAAGTSWEVSSEVIREGSEIRAESCFWTGSMEAQSADEVPADLGSRREGGGTGSQRATRWRGCVRWKARLQQMVTRD